MSRHVEAPPNGVGFNVFPVARPVVIEHNIETAPEDYPCDACGAEPNEPCRVGCLGYYVEHGDV